MNGTKALHFYKNSGRTQSFPSSLIQAVGGCPVLALVVGESIRVEELSGTTFASEEFAERHHDNE